MTTHPGLHVIGAGFGRTGTESLRRALDMLDLGPTHHMYEVIGDPDQRAAWRAVGLGAVPDWNALLEGYRSVVDWPCSAFWQELMAAFPDAAVILTLRDGESWWKSFSDTILAAIEKTEDPQALNRTLIAGRVLGGRADDKAHAIATYEAHNKKVRALVPPERLIVQELGGGWGPLCTYFGLPEPAEPFPSGNASGQFTADGTET